MVPRPDLEARQGRAPFAFANRTDAIIVFLEWIFTGRAGFDGQRTVRQFTFEERCQWMAGQMPLTYERLTIHRGWDRLFHE